MMGERLRAAWVSTPLERALLPRFQTWSWSWPRVPPRAAASDSTGSSLLSHGAKGTERRNRLPQPRRQEARRAVGLGLGPMGSSRSASLFDLRSHYAFYGAYHADSINKAIHVACVWPILFSALLLLHYVPLPLTLPGIPGGMDALPMPWGGELSFNCAALVSVVYAGFYVMLEPKAGSMAAALVTGCLLGSHALLQLLGASTAWKVALAMQVFCWAAQFIGHGVFEGRAPALLDNLVQAFLMAPFFVLLEVLHWLVSFEPEAHFWAAVEQDIREKKKVLEKSKKLA